MPVLQIGSDGLRVSHVVAVVPRLITSMADAGGAVSADAWGDTRVVVPTEIRSRALRDVVSGARHDTSGALRVGDLLRIAPVALLRGE